MGYEYISQGQRKWEAAKVRQEEAAWEEWGNTCIAEATAECLACHQEHLKEQLAELRERAKEEGTREIFAEIGKLEEEFEEEEIPESEEEVEKRAREIFEETPTYCDWED